MYTAMEFKDLIRRVPKVLNEKGYIEPKYDGSNITVVNGVPYTRNLNPLPTRFQEGLKKALGSKYNALIELSKKYQVFLELGGFFI